MYFICVEDAIVHYYIWFRVFIKAKICTSYLQQAKSNCIFLGTGHKTGGIRPKSPYFRDRSQLAYPSKSVLHTLKGEKNPTCFRGSTLPLHQDLASDWNREITGTDCKVNRSWKPWPENGQKFSKSKKGPKHPPQV